MIHIDFINEYCSTDLEALTVNRSRNIILCEAWS
jgi:hypothetical protein